MHRVTQQKARALLHSTHFCVTFVTWNLLTRALPLFCGYIFFML